MQPTMSAVAFQDQIPNNACFGCGPDNHGGLRIRSYWDGADSICTFMPEPHHCAGPTTILNGGIIASIIDCHCVGTAIAQLYRVENRAIGSAPIIWCATGSMTVNYLRPTPIDRPVLLRARIIETKPKKVTLHCSLFSGELECANAQVVAVRVPDDWRAD